MKVLSLFDGMSCAQIALNRIGVKPETYYAAELDKHCIKVTQSNYPNTIQLGSVTEWQNWNIDWFGIDLLIGGSPCQGFSFAGKQLAFDDPRSKLFFTYVEILNFLKQINPNIKFLLENVKMKRDYLDVITDHLGVDPIFINSTLVSAQNRQRYYWCNWEVSEPEDRGVMLADILETDGIGVLKNRGQLKEKNDKSNCITASYWKGADNRGQRTLIASDEMYRKLTPVECERLQTVPDNYTAHVSNTQRYKMLGNGFTVDVIAHLLKQTFKG